MQKDIIAAMANPRQSAASADGSTRRQRLRTVAPPDCMMRRRVGTDPILKGRPWLLGIVQGRDCSISPFFEARADFPLESTRDGLESGGAL